jgi:hypothetical protein
VLALSLSEKGSGDAPPNDSTPGNALSWGRKRSKNCRCFSGFGVLAPRQHEVGRHDLSRIKSRIGRS